MKQWLFTCTLFIFGTFSLVTAQTGQFTSPEDSDPEAKAILDKVRNKYNSYKSLQADFRLDMAFPEQPLETQKGSLARSDKKYRMELGSYAAVSNGESVWLIMHHNKEIQINDMPDPDEVTSILSPEAMLNFYDRGEYVYFLMNEMTENGRLISQIEFKPLDRYSDYSKLRMTVDKKKNEVVRIKVFSKDGSNYTLWLDKLTPNKAFAANHFVFDKSKYRGIIILRI